MRLLASGPLCQVVMVGLFGLSLMRGMVKCDTATDLQDKFKQSRMLIAGVTKDSGLFITKESLSQVYEVPVRQISSNLVSLNDVKAEDMPNKWRSLASDSNFQSQVLNNPDVKSVVIPLKGFATLFFVLYKDKNKKFGTLSYDIGRSQVGGSVVEIENLNLDDSHFFFSSNEKDTFYNLKNADSVHLEKYQFDQEAQASQKWTYFLCENSSNTIEIFFSKSKCSSDVKWTVLNGGFYDQKSFHLFGSDKVYIFDYTDGSMGPFEVQQVKLSDYFVSQVPGSTVKPGNQTEGTQGSTKKTQPPGYITTAGSSAVLIIVICIVIGLVLSLVAALLVYFCCCKSSAEPPKEKPTKPLTYVEQKMKKDPNYDIYKDKELNIHENVLLFKKDNPMRIRQEARWKAMDGGSKSTDGLKQKLSKQKKPKVHTGGGRSKSSAASADSSSSMGKGSMPSRSKQPKGVNSKLQGSYSKTTYRSKLSKMA